MTKRSEAYVAAQERKIKTMIADAWAAGACPHSLAANKAFMRAAVRVRAAQFDAGLSAGKATLCSFTGLSSAIVFILVGDVPADLRERVLAQLIKMVREGLAAAEPLAGRGDAAH
jgi:hypothetical protein